MLDPRAHGTILGQGSFSSRDFFSPTSGGGSSGSFLSGATGGNDFFGPSNFGGDVRELGAGSGGFNPFTDQSDPHTSKPSAGGFANPQSLREGAAVTKSPWSQPGYLGQPDNSWQTSQPPPTPQGMREGAAIPKTPNPGASDPTNPFGYAPAPWGTIGRDDLATPPTSWGTPPQAAQPAAPRAPGPMGPRMQRTAGSGGYYGA